MKKLLVILLLLFPVHGAWSKVIDLTCDSTDQTDRQFNFTIDTKKKTVSNEHSFIVSKNLIITNRTFNFEFDVKSLFEFNTSDIIFHYARFIINRVTGESLFKFTYTNPKVTNRSTQFSYVCDLANNRKF